MNQPLLLVYLDAYHLGDPLFFRSFGRDVQMHEGPMILLHGSGEEAERAFEAKGWLSAEDRASEAARTVTERVTRDLNRRIVHELNEAGISALGVLGADRGLFRRAETGQYAIGNARWLHDLAEKGVVPAVGLLATDTHSAVVELRVGHAFSLLTDCFPATDMHCVWLTTSRQALVSESDTLANSQRPETLADEGKISEKQAFLEASQAVRLRVTRTRDLRGKGVPEGVDVVYS